VEKKRRFFNFGCDILVRGGHGSKKKREENKNKIKEEREVKAWKCTVDTILDKRLKEEQRFLL